jgi:arginine utilization protein RocB
LRNRKKACLPGENGARRDERCVTAIITDTGELNRPDIQYGHLLTVSLSDYHIVRGVRTTQHLSLYRIPMGIIVEVLKPQTAKIRQALSSKAASRADWLPGRHALATLTGTAGLRGA